MNILIQPLRKCANGQCQVLATKLILPTACRTAVVTILISVISSILALYYLHIEAATKAFLNDHAANLAVEVAEDVVQVGAPCIGGDSSRVTLKLGSFEDRSAAAVLGRVYPALPSVLVK
jgi:hypothetical protein